MKRICLVIPTFTGGGMERVMSGLANFFSEERCEIHIIFLVRHVPFYKTSDSIKFHFPNHAYGTNFITKVVGRIQTIKYLRQTIKQIAPTTVFSIPQGYSNLTILALFGTNIPIYVSDRSSPLKNIGIVNEILRKLLYRYATGIISQTEFAKQILLRKGIKNDNIKVLPNPIKNFQKYSQTQTRAKKRVLNIGRLVPEKNQKELIEIFAEINDPDWELFIVGDGPLLQELQNIIRNLGQQNKIHLLGAVKDVDKIMSQADIFAFTSVSEGFPNALMEAMAFPLACISYDCISGPGEIIIDDTNGFLIERENKNFFKMQLIRLMKDLELRQKFQENGKELRERYSMDVIGKQYLDFILGR